MLISHAPSDLAIVTCYFNSENYETKLNNYLAFKSNLTRIGLPCFTVECTFGEGLFVLEGDVLRVQARDVMWQKERLLNLAIQALPGRFTKVAWLDCDLLFQDDDWAQNTSRLLDKCTVVQPFKWVVRLPRGHTSYLGAGEKWKSFGAVYKKDKKALLGGRFDAHGHTGFAWAARREVLAEHGLYDACIAGSGDHMIAHAVCGDHRSICIDRIIGRNSAYRRSFEDWAMRIASATQGRLGYVPGTLLHLWHGDIINRRYVDRNRELEQFSFDPQQDLQLGPTGCWEWTARTPQLRDWAIRYFSSRREDGEDQPAPASLSRAATKH